MSFEIMSANETFITMITFELTISEMSLNVRFDILFPAEPSIAAGMKTDPLPILRVWTRNVGGNFFDCDPCLRDRCLNSGIEIEVVY
jgi:hypothetical protein